MRKAYLALLILSSLAISATSPMYVFFAQRGTPVNIPNFIVPEAGCNWTGVAGQVFDRLGQPKTGLVIRVFGALEGQNVNLYTFSGSAVQMGNGGFEISLADHLVQKQEKLFIQLFDVTGKSLSGTVSFLLSPSCDQNLTLLNFVELPINFHFFYPFVIRK